MSHFTCLAIGNLEEVMAPFNEQASEYFTKTKENHESYIQDYHDVMNGTKKEAHDAFFDEYPESDRTIGTFIKWWADYMPCYNEDQIKDCTEKKQEYAIIKDNVLTEMCYFSNPNAKYDYYQEASARWDCDVILKDGSHVSEGRVGDIDIDAMVDCVRKNRADSYDKVCKHIKVPINHTPFKTFQSACQNKEMTREEALDKYNSQPVVKKFRVYGQKSGWFNINPDDFLCTRDEYINNAALPFFSVNILGEWSERGSVGWWAIVSDEKNPTAWRDEVYNKLKDAIENHPDETFTLIDCHI